MIEIVSVIEDTVKDGCRFGHEHGLSLYINQNGKRYLLDTGASGRFLQNAIDMDIDLMQLDGVIISHNHYDHIGGLKTLLEYNKHVKVYIKKAARSEFFYKVLFVKKYIGEPKGLFAEYADRFVFIDDRLKLTDNIYLLSNRVDDSHFSCKDHNLSERQNGRIVPDQFKHELFVVVEEKEYLVILSSCSHNGIVNILRTVRQAFANKPIKHIVGGFHMIGMVKDVSTNCSIQYIEEVSEILDTACTGKIYTCHCTGKRAYHIMKDLIPAKIEYFSTGQRLIVE